MLQCSRSRSLVFGCARRSPRQSRRASGAERPSAVRVATAPTHDASAVSRQLTRVTECSARDVSCDRVEDGAM